MYDIDIRMVVGGSYDVCAEGGATGTYATRKLNLRQPEVEPTVGSGSDDGPLIYSSYIIINYIYTSTIQI